MGRCRGYTKNLNRCGRSVSGVYFCDEHRRQPVLFIVFFIFTICAGSASIYSLFTPSQKIDPEKLAGRLMGPLEEQLQIKDDQIKALAEAIAALSQASVPTKTIDDAFQALKQKKTDKAKAIFAEIAETKTAEGRKANQEAAAAFRHLGALAFLTNTQEAISNYQKAVKLDPTNPDGWNQLGHLLSRVGELKDAEEAYHHVLAIGKSQKEKRINATALGNLGLVYSALGDVPKAIEHHQKALVIHREIGYRQGEANQLGNLGLAYSDLGEVPKAIEHLQKALVIFEEIKSPTAERVHQWLEELASTKTR
jgi:tetratricopeptide (TPR) repeat protein